MANANNIIKELLFESRTSKQKKGLKLFYNIDIFIKDNGQENQEQAQPVAQAQNAPAPAIPAPTAPTAPTTSATATPAAPAAPAPVRQESLEFRKNTKRLLLREDEDIDKEKRGEIEVSALEVDNIQTMEDLVDFLVDKKKKDGQPIFNEFCSELVLTLTGSGEMQLSDLLRKEDKVLIDIDYGEEKTDSVGFKVLKRSGVQNISIMMKKDGNILPSKFDINDFNTQVVVMRNSVISDGK